MNLKRKKTEKQFKFDYIWASFCSAGKQIDWTPLVLSTAIPKSSSSGYICLYDLRKHKTVAQFSSLSQSPSIKALVLVNTCDGYKISEELFEQTELPVLVVTKGTGDALASLMRDLPEARVEFGGTDEGGEGQWVVEGGVGNTIQSGRRYEWEECLSRSVLTCVLHDCCALWETTQYMYMYTAQFDVLHIRECVCHPMIKNLTIFVE